MSVYYRPTHQWQGDPNDDDPLGWYDCGAFSAAMGTDAVSGGAVVPSGGEIRRLTDEPTLDKTDPGLTLPQLMAACDRFGMHWINRSGKAWNVFVNDLKQRRFCVLNVWYAGLPEKYRSQKLASFGHATGAMAVSTDNLSTLWYDPLAHEERWIPLDVLRLAAEQWARQQGMPGKVIYIASAAQVPLIYIASAAQVPLI